MPKKPPKKWRITIFWSVIGLVLFDLLRRPVTYTIQTWRGDIFYQEIYKMTHGERPSKLHELSGFAEQFASFIAVFLIAVGFLTIVTAIALAMVLIAVSIKRFYLWAYDD